MMSCYPAHVECSRRSKKSLDTAIKESVKEAQNPYGEKTRDRGLN
jgi:hypothetical protein